MVYSSLRLSRIAGKQNLQEKMNNKIQHNKLGVANCCCCAGVPLHCDLPGVLCAAVSACLLCKENNSMNRLRQKRISLLLVVLSGLCLFWDKFFNGRNNKFDIKMHQLPKTTVGFYVSEEWSGLPEVNTALFLLMQRCFAPSRILFSLVSPQTDQ